MKNRIFIIAALLMLVSGQAGYAMSSSLIGGVRDGLAIGIMGDNGISRTLGVRYGIEANTGKNPLIGFFGAKIYASGLPMALGIGGVVYAGNNTEAGIALSMIFDRAFGVRSLFVECGVDFVKTARLQFQLGVKI